MLLSSYSSLLFVEAAKSVVVAIQRKSSLTLMHAVERLSVPPTKNKTADGPLRSCGDGHAAAEAKRAVIADFAPPLASLWLSLAWLLAAGLELVYLLDIHKV